MNSENSSTEHSTVVCQVIKDAYGIDGVLRRLSGENVNYFVETQKGPNYVAKVLGEDYPSDVLDMEIKVINHLEKSGLDLLWPIIIKNRYGEKETRIIVHNKNHNRLILMNYMEGDDLENISDISDNMRFELGKMTALFDQVMKNFDHPSAHRKHVWDLASMEQHKDKISIQRDLKKREILSWAFVEFTNHISPVLDELRWQFIHGDLNPENIRVKERKLVGVLDFGDSCHNPLVCELAICLAYQMMTQADPWIAAKLVVDGFESITPLSSQEKSVLLPLVCGRLAVTICIASERRMADPENANWFVSEKEAWRLLSKIKESGRSSLLD